MGKVARVLDKAQDAQAVIALVDQLQKAIIIYQVCTKSHWVQARLTRVIIDVPTAINPQPIYPVGSKFLCVVSALRLTGDRLIQVFIQCISETQ